MPNQNIALTGELNREISRTVTAIYKDYLGRGPTMTRTTITPDMVVCVLEDSLTKAEQTLIANGGATSVRNMRREFQDAMRTEITQAVEQLTGRKAKKLLSDHSPSPDVAVETVLLEPLEDRA